MKILGISAFYHDAAACLLINGEVIAAVQEERFTRKKHDESFPSNSITYCIESVGLSPKDIDYVIFYEKPFLKFERIFETYLAFAPKGYKNFISSLPVWIKDKLFQKSKIISELCNTLGNEIDWKEKLLFSEHHLSHAASAFFPSPFEESAILVMDGVGEWATTSLAIGASNNIFIQKQINFPHSLGLLYSAFTYYTGFKVNSGEYKVMGLAPYGKPIYSKKIKEHLIDIKADGSFQLDMNYFNYCTGLTMTSAKFNDLFGGLPRASNEVLTQREMDLAASVQDVIEDVVLKLAAEIKKSTGQRNLCLAGGVALNCVANGKLLRSNIFDNIWIQPAAGDAGGAVGAAMCAHHIFLKNKRFINLDADGMKGGLLGPAYSQDDVEKRLKNVGAVYKVLDEDKIIENTAILLTHGKAIGWHQGRMEFGPRALGARSIIADARSSIMQRKLNLKVKFRESFRPFAPSVLSEFASDWFQIEIESPYMLLVGNVQQK